MLRCKACSQNNAKIVSRGVSILPFVAFVAFGSLRSYLKQEVPEKSPKWTIYGILPKARNVPFGRISYIFRGSYLKSPSTLRSPRVPSEVPEYPPKSHWSSTKVPSNPRSPPCAYRGSRRPAFSIWSADGTRKRRHEGNGGDTARHGGWAQPLVGPIGFSNPKRTWVDLGLLGFSKP
jgi:hypothetical protein